MPQMGESVAEGTITRWLKKEGEAVSKDEPLFEISTEKVDAEIPSPIAGVLGKILVKEGQTVAVHTVVAQIEAVGSLGSLGSVGSAETPQKSASKAPESATAGTERTEGTDKSKAGASAEKESSELLRASPLVRRMAEEHGIDLSLVEGTGTGGRITKEDFMAYLERQGSATAPKAAPPKPVPAPTPAKTGERDESVPMTIMRKRIAEHMVMSRRTSAHVTTVFQVDLSRVAEIYRKEKAGFENQEGVKLTYTPFFIRALIDSLKRFPILNSSVNGDQIVYHKDIHMGIAVALEGGLIVPVVHHVDEKNFLGLVRTIHELAARARQKKLTVDDVQGGTFTITNPGVYGGLFATPIINQPQVGILGVGTIYKAPVVIQDAIAIRTVVHLALSFDHRVVDGAVADQFMASVKKYLEGWEESLWA